MGVKIDQHEIDRAHRVGRPKADGPRSIIVKLKSFGTKTLVTKNRRKLKGKNLYVNEDLTKPNQELYMQVRKDFREVGPAYTGAIFIKRRDYGSIFRIRRKEDLLSTSQH